MVSLLEFEGWRFVFRRLEVYSLVFMGVGWQVCYRSCRWSGMVRFGLFLGSERVALGWLNLRGFGSMIL